MTQTSPLSTATVLLAMDSASFDRPAALALTACVYRIDIQQGNLLDHVDIDQIEVGMTRSQVQFLLGTPMVADSFHRDRWDYAYYFRRGRSRD